MQITQTRFIEDLVLKQKCLFGLTLIFYFGKLTALHKVVQNFKSKKRKNAKKVTKRLQYALYLFVFYPFGQNKSENLAAFYYL